MWFKKFVFLVLLLFPIPSLWAMGHISTQSVKSSLIGKPAPDAVLVDSNGQSAHLMASRQGKKAILIFWATWCPSCYVELGDLNGDIASIEAKGINIILVDVGETKEDVKKYFDRRQMKLTSFVDSDNNLQDPYQLVGIPTLIFIDEHGIIRNMTHEFPSDYEKYFAP